MALLCIQPSLLLALRSMGDLCAARLLNSSFSSLTGGDRSSFPEEQFFGRNRLGAEAFRNLCISFHSPKACLWKALLDDQRLPFALRTNERIAAKEELNIFDRLALAWRILFPTRTKVQSNAEVAKQRLKMILISDRCSVNENAKRRIVNNIVGALADFVEIEPQLLVQLNVSADPDFGTVYSVCVPVRRVKPEFQENDGDVMDDECCESLGESEVKFDFPEAQDVQELKSPKSQDMEACDIPEPRDVEG